MWCEGCGEGEIVTGEGCDVRGVVREKLSQVRGMMWGCSEGEIVEGEGCGVGV